MKFNITHTFDADLKINLKAPNNNVLNLVNSEGGAGQNFINTIISSNGVTSIIGGVAPFTNTYKAGAANNIGGATIVPGNTSNVILFANLFSTPNGNWIFSARDVGIGDVGTINDWTITINYTIAASPNSGYMVPDNRFIYRCRCNYSLCRTKFGHCICKAGNSGH